MAHVVNRPGSVFGCTKTMETHCEKCTGIHILKLALVHCIYTQYLCTYKQIYMDEVPINLHLPHETMGS